MQTPGGDEAPDRRTWRSIAGAAACIVVVIGVIAFVAARIIPESPEGPTALAENFDDLSLPEPIEAVASVTVGGGPALFGERAAAVQIYASPDAYDVICRDVEAALRRWGEIIEASPGPTGGCGFRGRVAEGSKPEFRAEVVPRETYLERAGSGGVYWEGAATSSAASVIEIEILT